MNEYFIVIARAVKLLPVTSHPRNIQDSVGRQDGEPVGRMRPSLDKKKVNKRVHEGKKR
jgi:hypothetical protein